LTLDRSKKKVVVITTAEGGVDIEELASKEPEKIQILPIDPLKGIDREKLDNCIGTVFNDQGMAQQAKETVLKIFKLLNENDCSLVEINPFASVGPGRLVALDAKIIIDDSSLFKHPDLASMRNEEEYTRDELEARTHGLSFVNLDGTIGCIVNGAGLAMATMDIIKLFGGSPANFLDVGGSSSPEKVVHAFDILTRNKKIKAVLINIFGGITRCDDIARGIVQAKQKMSLSLPLVIRLIGTNEKEGRTILQDAGIAAFDDLTSAVKEVVRHV
jgi:succinyl-CoA synthetase beta subunit